MSDDGYMSDATDGQMGSAATPKLKRTIQKFRIQNSSGWSRPSRYTVLIVSPKLRL